MSRHMSACITALTCPGAALVRNFNFLQWWGAPETFGDAAAAYWNKLATNTLGPKQLKGAAWGGFAEALVFFEPGGSVADIVNLPTAKLYPYINLGVFRGPWDAPVPQQHFLSFKGGVSWTVGPNENGTAH